MIKNIMKFNEIELRSVWFMFSLSSRFFLCLRRSCGARGAERGPFLGEVQAGGRSSESPRGGVSGELKRSRNALRFILYGIIPSI